MEKIKKNIEKTDLIIFLIVIFIFTVNLLGFYPGFLTPDSVAQLNQTIENHYTDAHPILHSFIIGNLTKMFGTVAAVGGIQIIMFAVVWTYACHIARKNNKSLLVKLFQLIFTVIICLIPINYVLSITVWKDIIFSYSVLTMLIYIYIGIKKQYNYSILDIVLLSLASILVMKIRHNGLAITLVIIPILIALNLIKTKKIKNTIIFISAFIICFTVCSIPEWTCNIKKAASASNAFNAARLYCMGALLQNNIEIEEDDREFLDNIIPTEEWANAYNPYHALDIFYNEQYNDKYLFKNGEKFTKVFNKYAKQHLDIVIKHFVILNSITWSPKELGRMTTFSMDNSYISEMANGQYQIESKMKIANKMFGKIADKTYSNKILYTILYRPAIPMYLSIILVVYFMIKNKKLDYILLSFPMFLNIGVYLLLLPAQDLRYYYPSFLTCYFLILIFMADNFKTKQIIKKEKQKVKKDSTILTIIPAYNESQNIQKVLDELKKDFPETDILVINDSSKDNTGEIVEKNNINCITTVFNLNYAYAVQTGIKYAKEKNYDYCLMFDGDGQHIAKEAKKLLNKIKESNADIVIGSRYLEKGNYNSPRLRKIGTNFFIWLVQITCNEKITDPLSGFQIINKRVIEKYSKMGEYPEFPDANLIIEMLLDGYTIEEVSVKMRNREFGESMHGRNYKTY